ncbi:MAG: toxic anion resistance protein [Alphaproteobacteria bacterium]|nr:toxic anion resistance protein [Alphaproteobacteria bacterium]MBF0391911.1 toxic anion resistance protein [Alphaproteobacteria bacterium]
MTTDPTPPAAFAELPAERRQRIEALIGSIDIGDSHSIIAFGSDAQRSLTAVSEQILEGVRNKDTGPAGEALNGMVLKVRDLDPRALREAREPGWFERTVLRRISPVARFLQRYETVRLQVERVQSELEGHRLKMVQDIGRLDQLYEITLEFFHELSDYILALEERLRRLDADELPAARAAAETNRDLLAAQRVSDLEAVRADLERKLHDLRLTRQVTMQSLPSIRLNQDLDKALASKIQSVVLNTLPLWKNQMAQSVTLFRTRAAAGVLKEVSDTTNRLLEHNAASLKEGNKAVRGVVEEGIFGIDSIEKANRMLIEVIQESIDMTAEGRRRRQEAERRLAECERELKTKLLEVRDARPAP